MSFKEMLEEIPKLTIEQRQELVDWVLALDEEDGLTPELEALLDERVEYFRQNPNSGIPLARLDAELAARRVRKQ
jgi:hypothetical protein